MYSQGKWQKMNINEKMGNLASEVAKSFYWKNKDKKTALSTAERALELFDLTAEQMEDRAGLKEILKLRSVFCDTFFDFGQFAVPEKAINNYFLPFITGSLN